MAEESKVLYAPLKNPTTSANGAAVNVGIAGIVASAVIEALAVVLPNVVTAEIKIALYPILIAAFSWVQKYFSKRNENANLATATIPQTVVDAALTAEFGPPRPDPVPLPVPPATPLPQ